MLKLFSVNNLHISKLPLGCAQNWSLSKLPFYKIVYERNKEENPTLGYMSSRFETKEEELLKSVKTLGHRILFSLMEFRTPHKTIQCPES